MPVVSIAGGKHDVQARLIARHPHRLPFDVYGSSAVVVEQRASAAVNCWLTASVHGRTTDFTSRLVSCSVVVDLTRCPNALP